MARRRRSKRIQQVEDKEGRWQLRVAILFALLLVFLGAKISFNIDLFGTDTVTSIPVKRLQNVGSRLAFLVPFPVFGDQTDGLYQSVKVLENGEQLGPCVDWHGDVYSIGKGRFGHYNNSVEFSTSDNTAPMLNNRSYEVAYNPLAWLNLDWISIGLLGAFWLLFRQYHIKFGAPALLVNPSMFLAVFLFDRFATICSSPNFSLAFAPDSQSYISVASQLGAVAEALSAFRTIGYPIFYLLTPDALIPAVQLVIYFGSIYIFFLGVRSVARNGWIAMAVSLPLAIISGAYRLDVILYTHLLLPDSLALSFSLASVGFCLLAMFAESRKGLTIMATALAVFVAYQLKPSYLYLTVSIPLLSVGGVLLCQREHWKDRFRLFVVPLVAAVVVPLLMFCGIRYAVVGNFGLVSAGGYQLIGLAGNFLDNQTVLSMPDELKPFAAKVAEVVEKKQAVLPEGMIGRKFFEHIFLHYDNIIYGNGELQRLCPGILDCDSRFGELGRAILVANPTKYFSWMIWSGYESYKMVFRPGRWENVLWGGGGLALLIALLPFFRARFSVDVGRDVLADICSCELKMLLWLFFCFSLLSILVVILVAIPYNRYMLPARLFFMPLCAGGIAVVCRAGIHAWRDFYSKK